MTLQEFDRFIRVLESGIGHQFSPDETAYIRWRLERYSHLYAKRALERIEIIGPRPVRPLDVVRAYREVVIEAFETRNFPMDDEQLPGAVQQ